MSRRLGVIVVCRAVAPLHGFGGLERHTYDLVRHLLKRDVAVTLITKPPSQGAPHAHEAFGPSLRTHFVPYRTAPFAGRRGTTVIDRSTAYPLFGLRAGRLAAELVHRGDVQIVHGMGAACLGYARERRDDFYGTVPLVFNPHGMEEFGSTGAALPAIKRAAYGPLRRAVRACASSADCVIATDRGLVPVVRRHLDVGEDKIAVVPNAVDFDGIDRNASAATAVSLRGGLGLGPDDVLLVSVGRLEQNKGFQHLLAAVADLGKKGTLGKQWRSVIVGEGSERTHLERAIADMGLGKHVVLAGRVDAAALHGWYEAATLFVHPTLYEGSSIATLEAMAHGRAVVASEAGGLPDKVRPGASGWLVPPGDTHALASAIEHAVGHRDRLRDMGNEGRAIVEREFSWSAAADRLLELYELLLTGHHFRT